MNIVTSPILKELKEKFPDIIALNTNMSKLSYWRIGGKITAIISPRTIEELAQIRSWIKLNQLPSLIIGNTTNLLFTDENIDSIVIQIGKNLSSINIKDQEIIANAGVFVPCLARRSMQQGLTGLEHTIGIPGTLGGLVYMNGGSQRKSISQLITYIKAMDSFGNIKSYSPNECNFGYRTSIFQKQDLIITEIGLKLSHAPVKASVHRDMLQILRERSRKFPRKLPNCGSVFQSSQKIYDLYGAPGKIIEDCGLKGLKYGDAEISEQHANFIVNRGSAKASDVLSLINIIQHSVQKKISLKLKIEPLFIDKNGKINEII